MAKRGLTGTGTVVTVDKKTLKYVKKISGLGGSYEDVDLTCLVDRQKKSGNGLLDTGKPEILILFDNSSADSDYRILKAIEEAGEPVEIEIDFPPSDGTIWKSNTLISVSVDGDVEPGQAIMAKAALSLQDDWTITNPS